MGLVIPWSFTLALVDGYSVLVKCPLRQPGILLIIVIGDWVCPALIHLHPDGIFTSNNLWWIEYISCQVLSILTLAAASSTVGVVDVLLKSDPSYYPLKFCSRYQISAAMAFLSWFLSFGSFLFNLWLLPTLWSSPVPVVQYQNSMIILSVNFVYIDYLKIFTRDDLQHTVTCILVIVWAETFQWCNKTGKRFC